MLFPLQARGTFGRWGRQNVHQTVARAPFHMKNLWKLACSEHFWQIRLAKRARDCSENRLALQIAKNWRDRSPEHFYSFGGWGWQNSLIHWFVGCLFLWYNDSLTPWFIDSLIRWCTDSLTHWIIGVLIFDSLIHWFIDWFLIAISFFRNFRPGMGWAFQPSFMLALLFPQQLVGRPASPPGHQAWLCSTGSKRSRPGWLPQCPGHRLPNRTPPSRRRWCQAFGKHWPRSETAASLRVFSFEYIPTGPLHRYCTFRSYFLSACNHPLPATFMSRKFRYTKVSVHFEHQVWGLPVLFRNAFTPILSQRSPQKRWQDTFFSSSVHGVQASLHAASTKGTHEPSAPNSGMTKASTPRTMPMAPSTYAADGWFGIKTSCLSSIFHKCSHAIIKTRTYGPTHEVAP